MIPVSSWLERDFALDSPRWMYPQLVERIRGGPVRLEEAVRGLSRVSLRESLQDAWSIQEEAGHFLAIEPLWSNRLEQLIAGEPLLQAWPGSNQATNEARYNLRDLDSILLPFRRSREALVSRFESVPDELITRSAFHPRLQKPMRTVDLAAFVAEHDDHHLARIAAMKRLQSQGLHVSTVSMRSAQLGES